MTEGEDGMGSIGRGVPARGVLICAGCGEPVKLVPDHGVDFQFEPSGRVTVINGETIAHQCAEGTWDVAETPEPAI